MTVSILLFSELDKKSSFIISNYEPIMTKIWDPNPLPIWLQII
jgi:hypothetical protein